MGFLSRLNKSNGKKGPFSEAHNRATWKDTFKPTSKEDPKSQTGPKAQSNTNFETSVRYLLSALRSKSPGGWSDNRYEQSRHFYGIPYVAVHRGSEQLAQSEFQVSIRDPKHPDGKRPVEEDDDSPGARLIKFLKRPNNEDGWGDLAYMWGQQMDMTGMALTWVVPNKLGEPIEMYSVPTALAIPQPVMNPTYPHGYYRIQPMHPYGPFSTFPSPSSAAGAPIPAEWMMRMKYPHPLFRYDGYSPLTGARLHIDEIESIDRSRWQAQQRAIAPSAVLQMESDEGAQPLEEEEIMRIRAEFENDHMGPDNTGRLFVSTPGAKLEPWGTNPKEMDYTASWDQLAGFLFAALGIPKPVAGVMDGSSYAQLFAALKQYHLLTLQPKCDRIARTLTRFLCPLFSDELLIEVRTPRIDDFEIRRGQIDLLMQGKALTKNELRKEMDKPLTQEEWGEEIAGTDSQEQAPPGAVPGQPGMEQQPPGQSGQEQMPGGEDDGGDILAGVQPGTGALGQGSLGPRMMGINKNSLRYLVMKSLKNGKVESNGNGNGHHRRF